MSLFSFRSPLLTSLSYRFGRSDRRRFCPFAVIFSDGRTVPLRTVSAVAVNAAASAVPAVAASVAVGTSLQSYLSSPLMSLIGQFRRYGRTVPDSHHFRGRPECRRFGRSGRRRFPAAPVVLRPQAPCRLQKLSDAVPVWVIAPADVGVPLGGCSRGCTRSGIFHRFGSAVMPPRQNRSGFVTIPALSSSRCRSFHRSIYCTGNLSPRRYPCGSPSCGPFLPFYRAIRPDTDPVASASTSSAVNWL